QTQKDVSGDGVAGWRGVVEQILRTRDQRFMIDRRIEEAAVRIVGESLDDLIGELPRCIEITPFVRGLVRERESPGDAAVVLEQSGDFRRAHQPAVDNAR